ncbi:hypothetical protein Nepgr_010668 [Nepenthes gracilis]|uniref:Uncharacterized protein n=1 Tax=Nepenthes gracilis TaxID=150966 RepID=A0AAD3SCU9_NEPGR|nr:hypothetical protein Nepgr_010668 [Nepenthes gracilis]
MMPIVTPFDDLFAELFGRKSSLNRTSSEPKAKEVPAHVEREGLTSIDGCSLKNDSGSDNKEIGARISMPVQGNSQTDQNRPRPEEHRINPRFAAELDGVHCFETIVPY